LSKTKGPAKRKTWFPKNTKQRLLLNYSATPHSITNRKSSMIPTSSKEKTDTKPFLFFTPYNSNVPVTSKSEAFRAQTLPTLHSQYHQPPPNANNVSLDGKTAKQPTTPDGDDHRNWPEAEVQNPASNKNEPPETDHLPPLPSDDEDDDQQILIVPERRGPRPRIRPDPTHEGGKDTQGKNQDDNNKLNHTYS
jgi:hypothetical protein